MKQISPELLKKITQLPSGPGVYLFKNGHGDVVYIGKAKSLKSRVKNYVQTVDVDWKSQTILAASELVEYVLTASELEAMLLEARLIQSYQPPCNVLLKHGQAYVYFLITNEALPRFELVRNKQQKGTYFGPFIEKSSARRVFQYLQKTFHLELCTKKIQNGCLAYHMGKCAGICRDDFDSNAYKERVELVRSALKKGEPFLAELDSAIVASNRAMTFERSAQLVSYKKAFLHVFESVATNFDRPQSLQRLADKDLWVHLCPVDSISTYLFLFHETHGVLKKVRVFSLLPEAVTDELLQEYLLGYYREYQPAQQIICSFPVQDKNIMRDFLQQWHGLVHSVSIITGNDHPHSELMLLAQIQAEHEVTKKEKSGSELKRILELDHAPITIDCFDISHKQGHFMVGSCVRFTRGQPQPDKFRHFHIKTVMGQNDYAALQEIVLRRYKDSRELPDLIVIDGGKGQLSAVQEVLGELLAGTTTQLVSLAKREETIFASHLPEGKVLDVKNIAGQLLIALRDYTHHFAISFHRKTESSQL